MNSATKARLIGQLRVALATKERVGQLTSPVARTGQIEVFKTEASIIINEHGEALLALLVDDEEQ